MYNTYTSLHTKETGTEEDDWGWGREGGRDSYGLRTSHQHKYGVDTTNNKSGMYVGLAPHGAMSPSACHAPFELKLTIEYDLLS